MAGIGITLNAALVNDGQNIITLRYSNLSTGADSGVVQNRYADGTQRAIGGYGRVTNYTLTCERMTIGTYEWLEARLGQSVFLRLPDGFGGDMIINRLNRNTRAAISDTLSFGVRVEFVVNDRPN